ncbi:cytochrome P450 CYP72A219-like protein [Cinnamomum micranthum f. kanehirae]|uniref:Cytochrome P450 CYP72A219-like protein n=1 Tax=Cinnamomum micranthum f. kanehirae TaxID=337451 RepID=A0A443P6G4_9MAGN|nr:cytochrome P450 CYP72A219-like protein [Cinnamomum micranthum f. kanehirae]
MASAFTNIVLVWFYRFFPTKANIKMKEIDREVGALLHEIIQRQKAMRSGMGDVSNNDLLGLMMEFNYKESQEHGNAKSMVMTVEDMIQKCKLFYFAGQETTSALLTWTMVALKRAREEALQVFGENKPDFDGLNHLKIVHICFMCSLLVRFATYICIEGVVTMILNEVLRLYPPVVLLMRCTYKEMKLGDVTLPPGAQVSLPTLLIHHHPEIWGDDAEEFKLERFSEGISKASKHQVAFFPFSWGPWICIGQTYAVLEAKLVLSMVLQQFSFKLSPSYAHAPNLSMVLK